MCQRSKRQEEVSSPLTILGELAPAHRALCGAMARVRISGAHYQALTRANEALARLAAELGHPDFFSTPSH